MGTSPEESFESAQYLAAWAGSEIAQFKEITHAFLDDDPAAMIKEFDAEAAQHRLKVRFKPLPFRARGLASNTIKNLRDALDQVVHAATYWVVGRPRRNAHFPFGTDPDDLESAMAKGPCKDIPVELYPILRSYQPYPTGEHYVGGDNFLKLLGKISGSHKHRTTLVVSADSNSVAIENFDLRFGEKGGTLFSDLRSRPNQNEIEILSMAEGGQAKLDVEVAMYIAFAERHLREIPAVDFLTTCHGTVTHIVQDLQAKALQLPRR